MTRELKFTSEDFVEGPDDCYLDPDDPIHEYKRTKDIGVFNRPRTKSISRQFEEHQERMKEANELGIKPGSPAWYAMFPKS